LTTFAGSTATNERIATLIAERTPGYALPGSFYLDQEVFALDVAAVFATHWIFVATEAEVPEPGDFVTVEIGPYSVIIVREDDGVRALHNVCRHRGARVLREPRGSVGNLGLRLPPVDLLDRRLAPARG
jgi:glycine betaine catabolism A